MTFLLLLGLFEKNLLTPLVYYNYREEMKKVEGAK